MRYSLLNRFQGTLLGVSFGRFLGIESLNASIQKDSPAIIKDNQLARLIKLNQSKKPSFFQQREPVHLLAAQCGIEGLKALAGHLICHQGWNEQDSLARELKFCSEYLNSRIDWNQTPSEKKATLMLGRGEQVLTSSEAAIILIPIALLFHEDRLQRHQCLEQLARAFWENQCPEKEAGTLIIAEAIAQALTATLKPRQFMGEILTHLPISAALTTLLTTVQGLVEHRVSLAKAAEELVKTEKTLLISESPLDLGDCLPFLLALYCFLSTPEDPKLSMFRAVQTGYSPVITTVLCGALSGAYNGKGSFPIQWQIARTCSTPSCDQNESTSSRLNAALSEEESLKFATELFALWSGVYNTSNLPNPVLAHPVVAAPSVIQPTYRRD